MVLQDNQIIINLQPNRVGITYEKVLDWISIQHIGRNEVFLSSQATLDNLRLSDAHVNAHKNLMDFLRCPAKILLEFDKDGNISSVKLAN